MNIIEKTYSVFLCLTRDDKFGDRHKRAAMALEMVTTFLLSFFIMIIIGLLNFKITNIFLWGLIIVLIAFGTYLFFNRYLIKSERYIGIFEEAKQYSKKKKISYAFLSVFLVLLSFCFLIGGGMLMSYLLSLH
jgi:hypothetical protein